jgi:hypothetical protein
LKTIKCLLVLGLLFVTSQRILTQEYCNDGYQRADLDFYVGSCHFQVSFCYKCNFVTGAGVDIQNINEFYDYCPGVDTWGEIHKAMAQCVMSHGCGIPPCGQSGQSVTFTYKHKDCKKIIHPADLPENNFKLQTCNNSAENCLVIKQWCVQFIPPNSYTLLEQTIANDFIGSPDCPLQYMPPLPPNGYDWDTYWETDCFTWTPCNQ